jgi:hypothetical protein
MNTITFQSSSKSKLNQLVKAAKELDIEQLDDHELTDEEMAMPGAKVSQKRLEEWLAKDDGDEEYSMDEVLEYVKKKLAKSRKKGNENSLQTPRKRVHS